LARKPSKIVSNEKILEKLSNLGFDVSQNARLLEKIYIA